MAQYLMHIEDDKAYKVNTEEDILQLAEEHDFFVVYEADFSEGALYFTRDPETGVITEDMPSTYQDILNDKNIDIDSLNREHNVAPFVYDDDEFVADQSSIQAVQNQCLTMEDNDPIPTPNGLWVLANDATRSFTVGEFKLFATAFFMRGSNNFGIKTLHKLSARQIAEDPLASVQDLKDYNSSEGWL